ncbi:MAG: 4-hydroxy-3-methylbut-2-enyl diphosphate reductase [Candidatus Pelagibacterales bacterium]|jgi:4-hydroxy-3-methylbut-2-enyl diphosphate reductase|nr:4-hydroxy-3-methylbut-2-enyl diphosphate reductase [Gammaproteobacteria bacterium]GIR05759.1 MAG: 4-hydroxy-3-methylbut-2-enyl diphosphate reductase [Pelagibacterales bacterium]|tara:strand:- start:222 stop:1166 length:945 start_codon:yes stop_codon:yes gene_type:complete
MKTSKKIYLISPRGFCAGVTRAIEIVELAIKKYGPPVYVNHEIVHNKYVIDELSDKGAVFLDNINDAPPDRPFIFSAHGVSKDVELHANKKNKIVINATCPLVTKVHVQAMKFFELGYRIILIGHKNHPEVIGTMGQLPSGSIELVETVSDVMKLSINDNDNFAYLTQTTLSLDDTKKIIEALKVRLPKIISSPKEDICYATSNRQKAIKEYAQMCDAFIVVGSSNSSNSNRLVEVAKNAGCENSILLENEVNLNVKDYELMTSIGISSGASVPDILVKNVINKFAEFYQVTIEELSLGNENVTFKLPKELRVG